MNINECVIEEAYLHTLSYSPPIHSGAVPLTGGALAEGFQDRLKEFQNFERTFEASVALDNGRWRVSLCSPADYGRFWGSI